MAAPIATAWGDYQCIQDRKDGILVTKDSDWTEKICELIENHELRLTLAANGRQRVEYEYSWNNRKCRKPWYDCFSKIFEVENPYHEFPE
jgi:glycosyltransferase involved in cell wall biosynthesis